MLQSANVELINPVHLPLGIIALKPTHVPQPELIQSGSPEYFGVADRAVHITSRVRRSKARERSGIVGSRVVHCHARVECIVLTELMIPSDTALVVVVAIRSPIQEVVKYVACRGGYARGIREWDELCVAKHPRRDGVDPVAGNDISWKWIAYPTQPAAGCDLPRSERIEDLAPLPLTS